MLFLLKYHVEILSAQVGLLIVGVLSQLFAFVLLQSQEVEAHVLSDACKSNFVLRSHRINEFKELVGDTKRLLTSFNLRNIRQLKLNSEANESAFFQLVQGLLVSAIKGNFLESEVLNGLEVLLDIDRIKELKQLALLKANVIKLNSSLYERQRHHRNHVQICKFN